MANVDGKRSSHEAGEAVSPNAYLLYGTVFNFGRNFFSVPSGIQKTREDLLHIKEY